MKNQASPSRTLPALDAIAVNELAALVLNRSDPIDALGIWVESASQAADFISEMADAHEHANKHGALVGDIYGSSIAGQAALIGFSVRVIGILAECAVRQHTADVEGGQ